jgi:OmpA-OmpF porin, OOP family
MKKLTQLKYLGATLALILATQGATAADAGKFYVGADIGSTHFSGDGPGTDSIFEPGQTFKDSDTSYGLHVGFQFADWFAVELGYSDFGSATDKFAIKKGIFFIVAPNDTQTLDAKGASLTGVFSYNLTSSFAILGAVGVSSMNYKNTLSGGFSEVTGSLLERHSFSDQGLIYGVGARYTLSDSVALRADLRRNDVGDFNLDMASVGVEYSF